MSRRHLYLTLAVVGAIVPYVFFVQFFAAEGLSGNFVGSLFANGAAGGFSADVLLSSVAFWVFLYAEARAGRVARPWIYVMVNLTIGLSCALPLFLGRREGVSFPRAR
jgi:hypothetical protein